jgi:photosystem II stability/assembly factor-like uncharacterized protein
LAQAQWTKITTPFSTFPSVEQSLYARGNTVLCVNKDSKAYVSLDAGKTWSIADLPDAFAFASKVSMTNKKLLVSKTNEIYASGDGGKTWKLDYNDYGARAFTVLQNSTFAATKNGIIAYNESTAKWEAAGLASKQINYLYNDGSNLFAFELKSNGDYVTHRSADKGKTWTVPSNIYTPSAIVKAGNILYATYGSSSGVATSDDKGVTWTQNSLSGLPNDAINDALAIDDTLYVSFKGGAFDPALGFYRYDAKGNTWAQLNKGLAATETNLVRLAYNGNGTLWAMQKGESNTTGALWSYKLGKQNVATKQLLLEADLRLSPNPATSTLRISSLHNMVLTSIKIFNLQGQLLLSQDNPRSEEINISSLAKGMYLFVADSEEGKVVRRFVKEGE